MAPKRREIEELIENLGHGAMPSTGAFQPGTLDLMALQPEDGDVQRIVDALNESTVKVCRVVLASTSEGVSDVSAKAIASLFDTHPSLEQVEMTRTPIGVEGAKAFADKLRSCDRFERLDLSFSDIGGDDGVIEIAEALEQSDSIKELFLKDVNMTDKGAKRLAEALRKNTSLRALRIDENTKLTGEGVLEIFQALPEHQGMVTLSLPIQKMNLEQQDKARDIVLNQSGHNFNECLSLVGTGELGDDVRQLLEERRSKVASLRGQRAALDEDNPDINLLMDYVAYRPAIESIGTFGSVMKNLDEHIARRPMIEVDETLTLDGLMAVDADTGYCPLDNPRIMGRFGEVKAQLGAVGVEDLLDKGKPTPFFAKAIHAGQAAHLFTKENWKDAGVGAMRAAYNAMDQVYPEAQEQVNDWPRLQIDVERQTTRSRER